MGIPSGKPNPMDRFFLKCITILLFGTLTVSRMEFAIYSRDTIPWYQILVRRDVILCLFLFFAFVVGMIKLGSAIRILNFRAFLAIPIFISWIISSGCFKTEVPLFFAVASLHWIFAYFAFLFIPPLLKSFALLDFAVDTFLAWAVAAGCLQILLMVISPDHLLSGVAGVFSGNRAHVGLYFLIALASGFYAWSDRRRRIHVAAIVISLICLLISGSRAAQTAGALFMCLLILSRRSWNTYLWGVPTIAGFMAFVRLILTDRGSDAFAITQTITIDASAGNRLIIWLKTWEIITQSWDHFFLGIGFGNFRFLYNKLVDAPFYANAAHNLYLHYWVETGLIGLFLLLIICASLFLFCWKHGKHRKNLRYMAFLTMGIVFTGFTQESFLPDPSFGNVLTLYFLIMGLATYNTMAEIELAAPIPGTPKYV